MRGIKNTINKQIILLVFLLPFLFYFSCVKIEYFPSEPEITYMNLYFRDSIDILGNNTKIGMLEFDLVDGDGNIGFLEEETLIDEHGKEYNHNCFISLYKIENNIRSKVELNDSSLLNYRIPYLQPNGQNPTLKGKVQIEIEHISIPYDSVQYEFYVIDREFNKSNIETSDVVAVDPN